MEEKLSYRNEDDKCYGATGMAIGVVVFDGEDMVSAVSLDADPSEIIEFANEFYFSGNPGLSAKTSWNQVLSNYNLSMAMLISNVMCRWIVLEGDTLKPSMRQRLHDIVADEGRDTCALEDDEINRLFDKNYAYLHRVFNHQGVQSIAHDFARELKRQRRFTRAEIIEQLRALSML